MTDHDRLFKELLTTFFVEFLELFAPELAVDLDRDSITFLDKEVFTDVTRGERHEVDILVRARFRGQDAFFLIHIESQAQDQTDFNERMFYYSARLLAKFRVPIYPIAIFSHDLHRPEKDLFEVRFPDLNVLRFQFRVIQLNRLNWREFIRNPNPVAAALMAKMKMDPGERPRVKLECLRLLVTLKLNNAKQRLISGFVDTYLQLNADESLQFHREADTILKPAEKDNVMELTTSWKEEGRQEGRREGEHEACAKLVIRQLSRRLGALTSETEAELKSLTLERLEGLSEALLDFSSNNDLVAWLANKDGK